MGPPDDDVAMNRPSGLKAIASALGLGIDNNFAPRGRIQESESALLTAKGHGHARPSGLKATALFA